MRERSGQVHHAGSQCAALHGHPVSGGLWEKHCDESVRKAGWEPLPPEWPSCYYRKEFRMFMIIYVDDFKLGGRKENISPMWKELSRDLDLDPPVGIILLLALL